MRRQQYIRHGTVERCYTELFFALLKPSERDCRPPAAVVSPLTCVEASRQTEYRGVTSGSVHLFQTMFYGDPMHSGLGSGGGLGTLVRELGNALGSGPFGLHVQTVVGRNTAVEQRPAKLREQAGPGHEILRVPYHGSGQDDAFRSDEATLRNVLSRTFAEELRGGPALVHTRYIDGASFAAAGAAVRCNCAAVCTITPDPHRNLCDDKGEFRQFSATEAAQLVYRVRVGDALVGMANAVVGIGRNSVEQQLLPYYPQLEDIKGRSLLGIDEGVQIPAPPPAGVDPWLLLENADRERAQKVPVARRVLPSILCVGRLHPAKAQPSLATAWVESGLYKRFNLILVGGDLHTPNHTEHSILAELQHVLSQAPEAARAGFLHIGALPNGDVRLLEAAFAAEAAAGAGHIYVCPSLKEEFGLSILEAMAAGLPVAAPLRGGAPAYIRHGINGLLLNTSSAAALTAELGALLQADSPVSGRLQAMAAAGRDTVRKRYSIARPAGEFAKVYSAALAHHAEQRSAKGLTP